MAPFEQKTPNDRANDLFKWNEKMLKRGAQASSGSTGNNEGCALGGCIGVGIVIGMALLLILVVVGLISFLL